MLSALMWRDLGISEQDWADTPQTVRTALLSLQQQVRLMGIRFAAYEQQLASLRVEVSTVDDLKAEIAELRERLGQNSSNSSKPPSSDPPSYKSSPRREPKGRKRGGQPGHQGSARRLLPTEEVDHLIDLRPSACAGCGRKLRGNDPQPERHQVSEVPPVRAEVTEYRRHTLRCAHCGTDNHAAWPAEMTRGAFGPRAQAVVGYLTGRLGASHRDVVEAMAVLYGLEVGAGSVAAIQRRVSEALREPVDQAARFVRRQVSQHVDETGWRESGHLKWLWVNATRDVTAFEVLGGFFPETVDVPPGAETISFGTTILSGPVLTPNSDYTVPFIYVIDQGRTLNGGLGQVQRLNPRTSEYPFGRFDSRIDRSLWPIQ